jgi:hypothetical protein
METQSMNVKVGLSRGIHPLQKDRPITSEGYYLYISSKKADYIMNDDLEKSALLEKCDLERHRSRNLRRICQCVVWQGRG